MDLTPEGGEEAVALTTAAGGEALFARADVAQPDQVEGAVRGNLTQVIQVNRCGV